MHTVKANGSPRIKALIVGVLLAGTVSLASTSELPKVDELLLESPFSSKHIQQVLAGEIAATKVIPVSETELAQGLACLVKSDLPENMNTLLLGTWMIPEEHILASAMLPKNASLTDFNGIRFTAEDKPEIQNFIAAKPGNKLNLSAQEIAQFHKLQTTVEKQQQIAAAEILIHQLLYNRYQDFQQRGSAGVAEYARSKGEVVQPGQQLITSVEESVAIKKLYPKLYELLIHYPQVGDLSVKGDSFWYMVNLGERPAVGLSHRLHTNIAGASFIFERGYYISHTLDAIQVLIALIPVQEGLLLIYTNRTWTEKISGFFGPIKRKIAYRIMISGMENVVKKLNVCKVPN